MAIYYNLAILLFTTLTSFLLKRKSYFFPKPVLKIWPFISMQVNWIIQYVSNKNILFFLSSISSKDDIFCLNTVGNKKYTLKVNCEDEGFLVREGNQWENEISLRPIIVTLNDKEGRGLIEYTSSYRGHCPVPLQHSLPLIREPSELPLISYYVITFHTLNFGFWFRHLGIRSVGC